MSGLAALAEAVVRRLAGPVETRASLLAGADEAFRAGWAWPEAARDLGALRDCLAPTAAVFAWEGGACALLTDSGDGPKQVLLLPAPDAAGRPHCPSVGLFGALLAKEGPALSEIPDGCTLLLPPSDDGSAHARLAWARHLPDLAPVRHPLTAAGVLLRRQGPLVAAFAPGSPWPLAMRRIGP